MGVVKKRKRGREAIEAPLWGRVLGRRRAYGPLVVSVWTAEFKFSSLTSPPLLS